MLLVEFAADFVDIPLAYDRTKQAWAEQAPVTMRMMERRIVVTRRSDDGAYVVGRVPVHEQFTHPELFPSAKASAEILKTYPSGGACGSDQYLHRRAQHRRKLNMLLMCASNPIPCDVLENNDGGGWLGGVHVSIVRPQKWDGLLASIGRDDCSIGL